MGNKSFKGKYIIDLDPWNYVGEGSFGRVYKIMTYDKKTAYAAKIFERSYDNMDDFHNLGLSRELKILRETSHPFVIKYMDYIQF
jgi:hypothetical protein